MLEWDRADRTVTVADGVEIGTGKALVPDGWIDLLCDNEMERAAWRRREFRKEL